MIYICLGYTAADKFETMPESERNAFVDECFACDNVLRKNGHFVGGHDRWELPPAETRHL